MILYVFILLEEKVTLCFSNGKPHAIYHKVMPDMHIPFAYGMKRDLLIHTKNSRFFFLFFFAKEVPDALYSAVN